jgi:hypothetical protein
MSLFFEIIQLLMEEAEYQYVDTLDEGKSPLPEVTVQETYLFMAGNVQVEHAQSVL